MNDTETASTKPPVFQHLSVEGTEKQELRVAKDSRSRRITGVFDGGKVES